MKDQAENQWKFDLPRAGKEEVAEFQKGLEQELHRHWKVGHKLGPNWAECLAYYDSRDLMDLLDIAAGPENWDVQYEIKEGVTFCTIGIQYPNGWLFRTDAGGEKVDTDEPSKSACTDAFKRAAVAFNLGNSRALYRLPKVIMPSIMANGHLKGVRGPDGTQLRDNALNQACEDQLAMVLSGGPLFPEWASEESRSTRKSGRTSRKRKKKAAPPASTTEADDVEYEDIDEEDVGMGGGVDERYDDADEL